LLSDCIKVLFDFFLPRLCITCNVKLNSYNETICPECYLKLEVTSSERIQNEFDRKFKQNSLIKDFSSAFVFRDKSEIQKLIHSLKYNQNFPVGKYLGKKTAEILYNKIISWEPDIIIPIPLHSLRKAERGFNQASEIAKGISEKVNIPHKSRIIKRKRFTNTQTKLSLQERKINISGAFTIRQKKYIKNKNIILVDDVITTGATISECAKLLSDNGAKNIYAVSAAIAD